MVIMNINLLLVSFSILFLALPPGPARADGSDSHGITSLRQEIVLTPSADAPAGSQVTGTLRLRDNHGTSGAELKLESEGLPAGTYGVEVTLSSDGSTVVLGTFDAAISNEDAEDDDAQDDDDEDSSEVVFGDEGSPFPAGFDPSDIATVSIRDANSVLLFTGNFTDSTLLRRGALHVNTALTAEAGAPTSTGRMNLVAKIKNGASRGMLVLNARGLASNIPVILSIDGTDVATFNTSRAGHVHVKASETSKKQPLSVSLFSAHSVHLHDAGGQDLVGADF
jgi:hypothetical protein